VLRSVLDFLEHPDHTTLLQTSHILPSILLLQAIGKDVLLMDGMIPGVIVISLHGIVVDLQLNCNNNKNLNEMGARE
jgi:hypothetical protein